MKSITGHRSSAVDKYLVASSKQRLELSDAMTGAKRKSPVSFDENSSPNKKLDSASPATPVTPVMRPPPLPSAPAVFGDRATFSHCTFTLSFASPSAAAAFTPRPPPSSPIKQARPDPVKDFSPDFSK